MKNQYKFLSIIALAASSMLAQQPNIKPCYTDEAMKYLFEHDPAAKARYEKEMKEATFANAEYASRLANGANSVSTATSYTLDTIPVVFHILHQNGPENVSDAVIRAALAEVNRVHMHKTPDSASIDSHFASVYGTNNYVFVLATIDPNGNCTNGIIRHLDPNTNWNQTDFSSYAYSGTGTGLWSPKKYLNVYIVKEICSGTAPCSQTGGIIVGYTYLPGGFTGQPEDAVVYNSSFLSGTEARSMAHEFGHWLGLSHTFGNTNSPGTCTNTGPIASQSDDNLAGAAPAVACTGVTDDTPKYAGAFSTCPPSTPNTCDVSNTANVQNIMDYSSCPLNFTNGQTRRMHNIMNSTTGGRNQVMTAANKIATGIRNPQTCIPVANFTATKTTACTGSSIIFSDSSANAIVTGWNWDFPGGAFVSGSTASSASPSVTYSAPGQYAVSYTASTSAGGNAITKTSYITIYTSIASHNTAFTEGFETTALPGTDWSISHSSTGVDWALTSNTSSSGLKSVMIDNLNNVSGNASILQSDGFDLSVFATPLITFKSAYEQQATTNNDKLQVLVSTDCGATWTSRLAVAGTTLSSVPGTTGTTPFIPTANQFKTYTVTLTSAMKTSSNVSFRWVFTSGTSPGNNLYLDDINISDASPNGIANIEELVGLNVYPNPSVGKVNLDFNLSEKHTIAVNVTDMLGRSVETIAPQSYQSGASTITIGAKTAYQAGVYLVNIDVDGQRISKKVFVQQ